MRRRYLLPLFLCFFSLAGTAQTVSGVPGYITVPSATFHDDGTVVFGAAFLPRRHLPYTGYARDAVAIYTSLTFLKFMEVDLRVTRQLNLPEGSRHVVDRVPTVRFRILQEKKWLPAVAIGFHDFLTSLESGEAHHFGASYVAVTKHFNLAGDRVRIGATAGLGTPRFLWKNSELTGPFGGLSIGSPRIPWLTVLADYDGSTMNAGIRADLFRRLTLTAATLGFDTFTGGLSYRFNLLR